MRTSFKELLLSRPDAVIAFVMGLALAAYITLVNPDVPSGVALGGDMLALLSVLWGMGRVSTM